MGNVLLVKPSDSMDGGTMIENIEVPGLNEIVYFGKDYFVRAVKHFPQGGKGIKAYSKYKKPFTRVLLA
jgi:hypothetical protein